MTRVVDKSIRIFPSLNIFPYLLHLCITCRLLSWNWQHILYKDQVKHLQRKGLWPDDDPLFSGEGVAVGSGAAMANDSSATNQSDEEEQEKDHDNLDGEVGDDDGIVYDADDLLFVNTNKISTLVVDSESESESGSDAGS